MTNTPILRKFAESRFNPSDYDLWNTSDRLCQNGTVSSRGGSYVVDFSEEVGGNKYVQFDGINKYGERMINHSTSTNSGTRELQKHRMRTYVKNIETGELTPLSTGQKKAFLSRGIKLNELFRQTSKLGTSCLEGIIDTSKQRLVQMEEIIKMSRQPGKTWEIWEYSLGDFHFNNSGILNTRELPSKSIMHPKAFKTVSKYIAELAKHFLH